MGVDHDVREKPATVTPHAPPFGPAARQGSMRGIPRIAG
jgi:hypothetical protein